jgi:hypothetical protein
MLQPTAQQPQQISKGSKVKEDEVEELVEELSEIVETLEKNLKEVQKRKEEAYNKRQV